MAYEPSGPRLAASPASPAASLRDTREARVATVDTERAGEGVRSSCDHLGPVEG